MTKIAFRVDNSVAIGTGHLIRCITLADELRRMGAQIHFVCRNITPFMQRHLESKGYTLSVLSALREQSVSDLAHAAWLGVSQETDAAATRIALADGAPWNWLVVDHYALDARWEKIMQGSGERILVIDDLADRSHVADLLLDQNLQSPSQDRYASLLPRRSRRLIGPRFALLRPEFHEAASDSPRPRQKKILNIFFGGTDPNGMTVTALEALSTLNREDVAIDVIVGIDNPHRETVAALCHQLPNTTLHVQPSDIGQLFASADLALGAGGTTSWERCCIGLPALLVSVAENQRDGCAALAEARAAINLGPMNAVSPARIAEVTSKFLSKSRLLARMRLRAQSLVDGLGATRVALYLMRDSTCLRPAQSEDMEKAWRWRNDPAIRNQSFNSTPLSWHNHSEWWSAALASHDRILLIAECGGVGIGVLRFDRAGPNATVSIYLDPKFTHLGLGRKVLLAGENWLTRNWHEIRTIRAHILAENKTYLRSFAAAGYCYNSASEVWTREIGSTSQHELADEEKHRSAS